MAGHIKHLATEFVQDVHQKLNSQNVIEFYYTLNFGSQTNFCFIYDDNVWEITLHLRAADLYNRRCTAPTCANSIYFRRRKKQMTIEHNNFLWNIYIATCFYLARSSSD